MGGRDEWARRRRVQGRGRKVGAKKRGVGILVCVSPLLRIFVLKSTRIILRSIYFYHTVRKSNEYFVFIWIQNYTYVSGNMVRRQSACFAGLCMHVLLFVHSTIGTRCIFCLVDCDHRASTYLPGT